MREEKREECDMDRLAYERYIERGFGVLKRKKSASKERNEALRKKTDRQELQNFKRKDRIFPIEGAGSQNNPDKLGSKNNHRQAKRRYKKENAPGGLGKRFEKLRVT